MEPERIAVLGAGSLRCMPGIAGSFAAFFGERPLEVRLFDADVERLDLFERFFRLLFRFNQAGHELSATPDPLEALDSAERVIFCVGENCAQKYFRAVRRSGSATGSQFGLVEQVVEALTPSIPDNVELLSLLGADVPVPFPHYRRSPWPPAPTAVERAAIPHQILRFLNGEDYPHALLKEASTSPLKGWLEDVETIPSILGRREA